MLQEVENKRNQVDTLSIGLKDELAYYTAIIASFLESITSLTQSTFDPNITREISAYANFLQSKERAGIERAVLSNVFSADTFIGREHLYFRLLDLVTTQRNFIFAFLSLTGRENKIHFRGQMGK